MPQLKIRLYTSKTKNAPAVKIVNVNKTVITNITDTNKAKK